MNRAVLYTLGSRQIRMVPVFHIVPGVGYCIESADAVAGGLPAIPRHDYLLGGAQPIRNIDVLIAECAFANQEHELCSQGAPLLPRPAGRPISPSCGTTPQV